MDKIAMGRGAMAKAATGSVGSRVRTGAIRAGIVTGTGREMVV